MLLSGTAARFAVVDAEGAAVSAGFDGVRRDQNNAPIASRTSATARPTIRAQFFEVDLRSANCDAVALCRAATNLCGTSGLPSSEM